ncbi:Bug family tripartite tricarboxylate transporter substrate binding protein [Variovorax saccharolyticus]|uniref:Bug family tripartite tricarboxylate transporter substrate binding protein n=1 Tax=Variovorax saccharolyticus TaxID=3053516 RepID=UPI00257611FA|nr:tripartite tricarboxylate transporter substrate binding protein [Variovorax sp. J31P216]MDM0026466.1 tripartite tricarboxylate transporter substrate binding protein [Variovorax sp. J31P216]
MKTTKKMAWVFALFTWAAVAVAQDFPSKPIRIVVPYAPGGTTDVLARFLGQRMSGNLGQPVVIENRPGAGEAIGAGVVAKAPGDGYTLLLSTMTTQAINPVLYPKLSFDASKELTAIGRVADVPAMVAVHPAVPAANMAEFQRFLKANPGRNYASPGAGTPNHLATELFKKAAAVEVVHIPYKGGAPAVQDLMAGQVDFMLILAPEAMPLVKSGKLRSLAITTPQRSPMFPDLPTVSESGIKDFELVVWYTLLAPSGTPKDVIAKLNKSLNAVLDEKTTRDKLAELSIQPAGGTPEEAMTHAAKEAVKWKKVIEESNIKVD